MPQALSTGLLGDPAGQERIVSRQEEVIQAPLRRPHAPTLADLMLHRPFRRLLTTEVGRVASKPRPHRNRIHPVHRTVTVVSTDCHDCRKLATRGRLGRLQAEKTEKAQILTWSTRGPHVVPT